ncbi:MAG: sugar transferase [Bacteroidota bacterium]|nr:sugar transferase [Bacteroidota bacterium]
MKKFFKYELLKRPNDIILSLAVITLFFIPVFLIMFIIKLSSRGPIFHKSYRIGKSEKPFVMLKIRTMNYDAPVRSFEFIKDPEKFYIRFGKTLRRLGIDEIPQLYNILKGDMSFVGPRPTLSDQIELIKLRQINNIYSVRPGLTGYAQINGRCKLSLFSKVNFDKYYIENMSLIFDMKIAFKTIPSILKESKSLKNQDRVLLKIENIGVGDPGNLS